MKTLRRLCILIICLTLAFGAVPAAGRASEPGAEEDFGDQVYGQDEGYDLALRFGSDARVETDGDGNAVAVNGYPTYPVRAGFNNLAQTDSFQTVVDFVEYPFWQPATQYDGNLAMMSLVMTGCASRPFSYGNALPGDFDPSVNLIHFLSDAGFEDIRKDDYSKVPTMFTVSTAMGSRVMTHEGEEPFTLIAIGICGERYENEWESNMTAGTGEIHEGFRDAAQLVIDRLAGYIATRHIEGRVKIWISGFSRAAAITNVAAGTIVKSGFLPKEDVFAYTFATPAAIKNPPQEGFENIFNIINPADPVPQVMPAEWGYGRYGTDLFLPMQEFASYEGGVDNILRNYTNREKYSVEYNYSSRLTLRTRLLLSLALDLTESAENYAEQFQPALVSIVHDKGVRTTAGAVRTLMQNLRLNDSEDETNLDELIDYLMRVFSGIAMRTGYSDADRNTGSGFMRFMVEHTPNAYFASEINLREGEFARNDRCCYVMVRGPVSLTLWDAEEDTEVLTVRSDGSVTFPVEAYEFLKDMFYTERSGDTTVIGVPMDYDYRVTWTAEKSGEVECLQAMTFARARSTYPGATSGKIRVNAGETGTAFRSENQEPVLPEGFTAGEFGARTLSEFMGIASFAVSWRILLTILFAVPALLVCIPLSLIVSSRPSRRKRHGFRTWALLCLLGTAAAETEAAYWFFADKAWIRIAWKGIAAMCFVLLFLDLHRKEEGGLLRSFLPAVVLAEAADVLISVRLLPGAALFLVCHALLAYQFLRSAPMSRGRWIQWAVVTLALDALIVMIGESYFGALAWGAAVYAAVLLLMMFSSGRQERRTRFAAILFLISDLLLGVYAAVLGDPMIHAAYMLLFYLAVLMLTVCGRPKTLLHLKKSDKISGRAFRRLRKREA